MKWSDWAVIAWGLISLIPFGYEMYCVLSGNSRTPPLTWVIVRYCPWWVFFSFWFWLGIHFARRYFNPAYVEKLKLL